MKEKITKKTVAAKAPAQIRKNDLEGNFIVSHFITKSHFLLVLAAFLCGVVVGIGGVVGISLGRNEHKPVVQQPQKNNYWFVLHRRSNKEYLYRGEPGDKANSKLIKTFSVKSGIPNERPTPLPHLLRREYWILIGKMATPDNPEIAPYFLTLDVPVSEIDPYGPTPYVECNGQCNWILPGAFGLHGVGGDSSKLAKTDPGSSGCIRHSDKDITYLYNLLDPNKSEIRYYIKDL